MKFFQPSPRNSADGNKTSISDYETSTGLGADYESDTVGLVLPDGTSLLIAYNSACGKQNDISCYTIMYDVNGDSRPNTIGEDIFTTDSTALSGGNYEDLKIANASRSGLPRWTYACSEDCETCGLTGNDPCCTGVTPCNCLSEDYTCEDGYTCNEETGACDCTSCICDSSICGDGYTCNEETGECEKKKQQQTHVQEDVIIKWKTVHACAF